MPVVLSLLRGINVGGHHLIKMDALRAIYDSLGLRDTQSHGQSGNLVFRTQASRLNPLQKQIESAIEAGFGFRPDVMLRTAADWREVIAGNPFATRRNVDPSRLVVLFLAAKPGAEVCRRLLDLDAAPEEVRISGRELYIHYANGQARPKLPPALIERTLRIQATGRNWNTVTNLGEIAERLDAK